MLRKLLYLLPTILLLSLFFVQPLLANSHQEYTVLRVVDGDTIDLVNGERVRLLGINAPEVGQPLYQEAADALTKMVESRKVELEKDPEQNKDKYGRFLRYVFVDGQLINEELVRRGLAWMTAENSSKHFSILKQAEQEAIMERLGVWSTSSS